MSAQNETGTTIKVDQTVREAQPGACIAGVSITHHHHYDGPPPATTLPDYTPPPPPDPDTLPDPGNLAPGSRLPFHRNALFTGRHQSLLALAHVLLPEPALSEGEGSLEPGSPNLESPNPIVITQTITGMGGIGKTQLAVEFAYRYGRYYHGVHWLNCAQPDLIPAEIAACGLKMQLPYWPDDQPYQVEATLRAWQAGGPRLLILDNLEDVAAARDWLPELRTGPIRLLLTARRRDWPADLDLNLRPLDFFTEPESRAFVRRHLTDPGRFTESDLDALAERLHHLPLTLQLAGRYLAEVSRLRPITIPSFLDQLDQVLTHPAFQDFRKDLGDPVGHDLDLAATFALSWEQIRDDNARRLFLIAGYCAPNTPIPCELLEKAAGIDRDACDRALSLLTGLGLLDLEDPARGPTIHPLLAEYAQSIAPKEEWNALSALADALAPMVTAANRTRLPGAFTPLLPHLEAVAPATENAQLQEAGDLWNELGYHLDEVADYAGARAAYERALVIWRELLGADHPNVASAFNNLGLVLRMQGDYTGARAAFELAQAIFEAALGQNHPEVARAVNGVGMTLEAEGDYAGARAAYERALPIFEAAFGPRHPEVASVVNNLGNVLNAQRNYAGARALCERALAIDESHYGGDHPQVAIDLNNLGAVLYQQGDLDGARAALERALSISEATFGREHPSAALSFNNLGMLRTSQGDYAGARAAYERALAIYEAVFGPDHPEVATVVNNLGMVLREQGDYAHARALCERALAICEAVFGPGHPNVATVVSNLGGVLEDQGDHAGARAAYERSLAISEAALGPDHPNVAKNLNMLGGVLITQRDHAGARVAFERALAIGEEHLGAEDPYVATIVANLGGVLLAQGDYAGARAALERALAIDERYLGAEDPSVATIVANLGGVLLAQGDYAGARAAYERALATLEPILPPDYPHIQALRSALTRLDNLAPRT